VAVVLQHRRHDLEPAAIQTVKTHVSRILMKLDRRDRAQAVVYAYESGLVVPGD
jgi:ATP/maltotriose-dependent transcriptional regulator MalT